jgi:RsiW-degrading membrane proteinase PrsW (M82 family)
METVFLLLLAIAPGAAIVLFIHLKDKHKPEPLRLLFFGVGLGALSFFLSLVIGKLLHEHTQIDSRDVIDQLIRAFIFVGLVEELSKFLFLRGILYRYFDEPLDGIVYAVMVAMGFATAENILYVIQGGGGTALIRMFTAVPAHGVFAVIMGFFLGEAKVFPTSSGLFHMLGLAFATFVHGFYDYFLFISFIPGLWIQAFVGLLIAVVLTHFAIKRHQRDSPFNPEDDD